MVAGVRSERAKASATCSTGIGWSRYRPSPSTGTTGSRLIRRPSTDTNSSPRPKMIDGRKMRSEEHTSELQSHLNLVCRLLLEKKKNTDNVIEHDRDTSHTPHVLERTGRL